MDLNKTLDRIRALIAQSEHPNTDPVEAATYREAADNLMMKYTIEEIQLEASRPADQRSRPGVILIDVTSDDWDMRSKQLDLALALARYTRTKLREYVYSKETRRYEHKLYGFESDLRYFELLYTTLRLHMLGVLRPKVNPSESLDENCYRLHNAGYNWLEIASFYGWHKASTRYSEGESGEIWANRETGERFGNHKVGSSYKRACMRACKVRGEEHVRIAAGGSKTYRASAGWGYVAGIQDRLLALEGKRGPGNALAVRYDDLDEFFRKENPDLFAPPPPPPPVSTETRPARVRKERAYVPPPFDQRAYSAGIRHAATADLMAGRSAPGPATPIG